MLTITGSVTEDAITPDGAAFSGPENPGLVAVAFFILFAIKPPEKLVDLFGFRIQPALILHFAHYLGVKRGDARKP